MQIAQTTLRSVLGKADLDSCCRRERSTSTLQQIIDEQTEPWGIKATPVEIKDVRSPQGCRGRCRARPRPTRTAGEDHQRGRRVPGGGEARGGGRGDQRAPAGLQLRYLQTLREIAGGEQSSTIVFPLPIDLVKPLLDMTSSTPEQPPAELHNGAGAASYRSLSSSGRTTARAARGRRGGSCGARRRP